jgi:hypothetical protein
MTAGKSLLRFYRAFFGDKAMYGMKSLSVCVLIVLLGNVFLSAHAQAPAAVTSATERVAAEKSVLTESSRQAFKPEAASADFCRCVGEGDNSMSKKIEQALAAPLHKAGLDYADQPLQDVVTQLSDEYGIPIHVSKTALKDAGISTDAPVSVSIHNISLRSALRLMLKSLQLAYVIQDEVLFITTPEDAENDLKVCVYDVRRIAGDKGELTPLMDTISGCVAKETWAKNGKGIAEICSPQPGFLVITQTQAVHNDIRHLLTTLDDMRRDHQSDVGGAPTKAAKGDSADRRIPASQSPSGAPRKGAESGKPVQSDAAELNPFGG